MNYRLPLPLIVGGLKYAWRRSTFCGDRCLIRIHILVESQFMADVLELPRSVVSYALL